MGHKLIADAATYPVTLAEAKAQLAIKDSVSDDIIDRHIIAATLYAEDYTSRAFITKTYELSYSDFPDEIEFEVLPVSSITSVKYDDTDDVQQTIDSANYVLDDYSSLPKLVEAVDYEWPTTNCSINNVLIRYDAGYGVADDVPETVKNAILLIVGNWINYQPLAEQGINQRLPLQAKQLLDRYRVQRFL